MSFSKEMKQTIQEEFAFVWKINFFAAFYAKTHETLKYIKNEILKMKMWAGELSFYKATGKKRKETEGIRPTAVQQKHLSVVQRLFNHVCDFSGDPCNTNLLLYKEFFRRQKHFTEVFCHKIENIFSCFLYAIIWALEA